jgi:hypothetical protein
MDDVRPRGPVTLRPIFTYLMIFDALLGFLTWLFLFLILNLSGVPESGQLISLPAGVVAGLGLWLRNSIQFTDDDLAVTVFFAPHRIPWSRVAGVSLYDISDDGTERVTGRRVTVRYHRGAEPPAEPMPTVFGQWRAWDRRHFRTLNLPILFPPGLDELDYVPRQPRTWFGRRAERQRAAIRAEFAARGYSLSELAEQGASWGERMAR